MADSAIAIELAKKQREISVSEFFERNKHILGFDNPTRAVITAVKEAVDNALDACEEANILPDIQVEIKQVGEGEYTVAVEDNGPGIVKKQLPPIFGQLLYGSRFHAIRQSRGQQGIGISAVVMYGQLTTGRPARIVSRIGPDHPAVWVDLMLDTKRNRGEIISEGVLDKWPKPTGTRIEVTMRGRYIRGAASAFEYMRATSVVNPHARVGFIEPDGTRTVFERASDKVPEPTKEIKPHPHGIELGQLMKMVRETQATKVTSFLTTEFTRVGYNTARDILKAADLDDDLKPAKLSLEQMKALHGAFSKVKVSAPPTDCLSPIGELLLRRGVKKEFEGAEFVATTTRPAGVYSGHPFQVEAAVAYGGTLAKEEPIQLIRIANRVPLLYQKGACASASVIESIDWRRYELEQRGGKGWPVGPAVVVVHVCSTNVPFTSEAKDAIADVDEIRKEVDLAIRDCARKMRAHIKKRAKLTRMREKELLIRKLVPAIATKTAKVLERPVPDVEPIIASIMNTVLVDADVKYEVGIHTVDLRAINYTKTGKTFTLIARLPREGKVQSVEPRPVAAENVLKWEIKRLAPGKEVRHTITVAGLAKTDLEEPDVFIDGVEPELVAGAEVWGAAEGTVDEKDEDDEEAAAPEDADEDEEGEN